MKDVLRIGFYGGGIEAFTVLESLIREPDFDIAFVHARYPDGPVASQFAPRHGVDVMPFANINEPGALTYVRDAKIDVLASLNCKQIFRSELLSIPPLGAINMHDGLLPRQRGGGGTFIGLVNGEPMGTTIHYIDDGIDTGDVILQQEVEMPSDARLSYFQERIVEIAPAMFKTALRQIRMGCVWRRQQKHSPYYYVPTKAPWDELIDWSLDTTSILDRVRGRTPGPTNFYICDGKIFYVLEVEAESKLVAFRNTVGQVIERRVEKGVLVKTGDTGLWITKIRTEDGEVKVPTHPLGAVLCQNLHKEIYDMKQRLEALESERRGKMPEISS